MKLKVFCSLFIKLICRHARRRKFFSQPYGDYEEAVSIYLSFQFFNKGPERKSGGEGTDVEGSGMVTSSFNVSRIRYQPITAAHCSRDMGTKTKEKEKVKFAVKTFLAPCL